MLDTALAENDAHADGCALYKTPKAKKDIKGAVVFILQEAMREFGV